MLSQCLDCVKKRIRSNACMRETIVTLNWCQGSQLSSFQKKWRKWRSHTCDGIKPGFSVVGLISSGYFDESPWDIAQTLTNIFNSTADRRWRDIWKCVCNKWIETPGWNTRVRSQDRSVSRWRKGTRRIRSKSISLIKY